MPPQLMALVIARDRPSLILELRPLEVAGPRRGRDALRVPHGLERMQLRGLSGARDEFHLAAIEQALKSMALRLLGPPPD